MIPAGIDDAKLRGQLLDEFNIEIAGGIGALKGQIWRLGLMGYCSQKPFVLQLLAAMEEVLIDQGHRMTPRRRSWRSNRRLRKRRTPSSRRPLSEWWVL